MTRGPRTLFAAVLLFLLGAALPIGATMSHTALAPRRSGAVPERPRPRASEHLIYRILVLGQRAGRVRADILKDESGRISQLRAVARTVGAVGKAFPVRNRQLTDLEGGKLEPTRTLQERADLWAQRSTRMRFGRRAGEKSTIEHEKGGKLLREERLLPPRVYDVLAGFLFLSSRKMKAGRRWRFPIYSGKKLFLVDARATRREAVYTPAFGMREAWRLDLGIVREPGWKTASEGGLELTSEPADGWRRTMTLWVSAANPGTILRIRYAFGGVGTVEVVLERFGLGETASRELPGAK